MIDFFAVQSALQSIISADAGVAALIASPANVVIEIDDREMSFPNMPYINIMASDSTFELLTLPNGYYANFRMDVQIVCFAFDEFKTAALQRDNLLKATMLAVRSVPKLGLGIVDSVIIGEQVTFAAGTPEQAGGHLAMATFRVVAKLYVDP